MSYILATNGYVECGVFTEMPPVPTDKQLNRFKWAEQYVHATRTIHGAIEFLYVQNGDESELICGSPAKTTFVYFDKFNISQRKESRDYIVNVKDLKVLGINIKPKEGDLIYEDVDGVRFTYRVGAFNGEPDYRYSGVYRTAFRIHSKLIKEEVL